MPSKGMVTAVLHWLESVEALGFTEEQINELADEYLEVQGVTPPKYVVAKDHFLQASSTTMHGGMAGYCACGKKGELSKVQRHIEDENEPPAISTYATPSPDDHTFRADSVGMGVHERWYCSCGDVFTSQAVAKAHRESARKVDYYGL